VSDFEAVTPESEQGKAMFDELLWVHSVVRRDLAIVRSLAEEVLADLPAEDVQARIDELQTNGPLWQLKVNCLNYCRFVHGHHGAEDALLFPRLRLANPGLAPVVDKLEADHRVVSDLLDDVEGSARALSDDDGEVARRRVSTALSLLESELITHLAYEELEAGPTIRRMTSLR
jgi:hemerythrin-like domain-containing protein